MNKFTKLLSIFVLAGAIGAGVAGAATFSACSTSNNQAAVTTTSKLTVADDITCLIVEGITDSYTLSTTNTSATIDTSAIKVYLSTDGKTKGEQLTSANYTINLYDGDGATKLDLGTALKDDKSYTLEVDIHNAVDSKGEIDDEDIYGIVTIKVINPITSIALKTGTTTQVQGSENKMTDWTYVATRANGDTEDIDADDVTVNDVTTIDVGTKTANISYTYNGTAVKGTVSYTVTEDTTMKTQSYAINISSLETGEWKTNGTLDETNGVTYVASDSKSVKINENSKSCGTKVFTQRLQLSGTSNEIVLSNINSPVEGATENTTIETKVTIYAISGSSDKPRYLSYYNLKDDTTTEDVDESTKLNVEDAVLVVGTEVVKCEFTLTEAGTYRFCSCNTSATDFSSRSDYNQAGSTGGMNIYYIQVDKIIKNAPTGVENVKLGGELALAELSLNTDSVKTTYKETDELDTTGMTAKAVYANSVTAESSEESLALTDLAFSGYTKGKLGEQTITATYTKDSVSVTSSYKITVETAVDGITGATAALKTGLATEAGSEGTLTFKKEDITVAMDGTDEGKAAATLSYTVKYNNGTSDVEITDSGVALTVGTYTLTVDITVTGNGETYTVSREVSLTVEPKGGFTTLATYSFTVADKAIVPDSSSTGVFAWKTTNEGGTPTTNNDSDLKFGSSSDYLEITLSNLKAGQIIEVTFNAKSGSGGNASGVAVEPTGASGTMTVSECAANADYADLTGEYTVSADGTVTLKVTRSVSKTLRMKSATIVIKGSSES